MTWSSFATSDRIPVTSRALRLAAERRAVLVTIDTDFGELVFARRRSHCGLVRLPDVRAAERILLLEEVLDRHIGDLERGAIVTVRGRRIRVSMPPGREPARDR